MFTAVDWIGTVFNIITGLRLFYEGFYVVPRRYRTIGYLATVTDREEQWTVLLSLYRSLQRSGLYTGVPAFIGGICYAIAGVAWNDALLRFSSAITVMYSLYTLNTCLRYRKKWRQDVVARAHQQKQLRS